MFFVSDMFAERYAGGAELTSEALICGTTDNIEKIESLDVTAELIKANKDKYWIFGNFSMVPPALLLYAAKHLNYSILEYDYKYCKYRSPEKHTFLETDCECHKESSGKVVSIFFAKAKSLWFMSENQKNHYEEIFPFLKKQNSFVLSSVFDADTLNFMKKLPTTNKNNKWLILNSGSWVKGTQDALAYAEEHKLEYFLAQNLPYKKMLETLASCKGLIFLPPGRDTCPRLVIEAKLLDCELAINTNVQHATEEWFSSKETAYNYLEQRVAFFWHSVKKGKLSSSV